MWAALKHPEVFLVLFVIFIIFAIWVLPKLWRFIKILLNKLRRFFGAKNLSESLPADSGDTLLQSHEPRQLPASDKLKQ